MRTFILFSSLWIMMPAVAQADQTSNGEAATTVGVADSTGDVDSTGADAKAVEVEPSGDPMRPRVLFKTTVGDILIELAGEKAPITVMNFIRYVEDGFYEGTVIHRVIKNFIIQGGRFDTEYEEKTEGLHDPIFNEWTNGLKNDKYTIAAARLNDVVNSTTSQFFINLANNGILNRPRDGAAYCVFGEIVAGQDTLNRIQQANLFVHPKYEQRQAITPRDNIVIENARVIGDFDRDGLSKLAAQRQAEFESVEQQRLAKMNKDVEEYVASYTEQTGRNVEKTESGLRYAVIKEGDGETPVAGDQVKVDYTIYLLNDKPVFSTLDTGEPRKLRLRFPLPEGWIEGLTMMKVGGKRRLIVPYTLAFKEAGRGRTIPPYASLAFEVELLGLTREADIPDEDEAPKHPVQTRPANPLELPVKQKAEDKDSD